MYSRETCSVEIKVRCFFLEFLATLCCFAICKHLMKRSITEYMDIFIKETKNIALAESKGSCFQL